MADANAPEEPEAPESIKLLKWVGHHLFREGAVIRKAPLATLVMAGLMFAAARWFVESENVGKINGLNGIIATKEAEIQFLDERLQGYESKSPDSATTTHARLKYLTISRMRDGRPSDKVSMYAWGMAFQNVGNGSAINPMHAQKASIEEKLLNHDQLDPRFKDLFKRLALQTKSSQSTLEIQAGDSTSFSEVTDIPGSRVDAEVVKGGKYLYALAVVAYRDSDTPPNKWRITEVCNYTTRTEAQTSCDSHNRIYLSD